MSKKAPNSIRTNDLIHNWGGYLFAKKTVTVFDTTLRDGLQSPQAQRQPTLKEKLSFLESLYKLGIEAVEIGFPVASKSHKGEVVALAKHAKKQKLDMLLSCLARTTSEDVEAIVDVSQKSGMATTVNLLIGSSKIRQLVEDWDLKEMVKWIKKSIKKAYKYNLEVEFVTEDTTRSDPKVLKNSTVWRLKKG